LKPTDFSYYLSDFLTGYLSGQRNLSSNTIKSYRDTFVFLLGFIGETRQLSPEKVSIAQIDKLMVEDFLSWLENAKGNSIATRNQRLAAIHAFFRYLQSQKPEYMFHSQRILSIPIKKRPQKVIDYLSEDLIKQLLAEPDISSTAGRRDQVLLSTLYDTGARVQELADLTVRDVRIENPAVVSITGKGRKARHIPIMSKTATLLSNYLNEQKLTTPDKQDHPLFFNSRGAKLTRQGVAYILKKYSDLCGFGNFSPHRLRHSKAMALTQADINPIFIRDFLGHADLKTTEIYSKTNIEMKRKALEKMNNSIIPGATEGWNNDEGLLEWLNNLGRY
jgi:site-specific recombinase XerD